MIINCQREMKKGKGDMNKGVFCLVAAFALSCGLAAGSASAGTLAASGPGGMRVALDGRELKVEAARCSAMPVNIRWPGHQRELDQTEICSFARFDFTRAASLLVTPGRPFTNVVVRPLSKKVAFRRVGDSVRLDLREPGAYSVEFDGRHRNLHVFADLARDYSAIDRSSPKVRYYGPGEHDAGIIRLSPGETLFLDEGAVVYGRVVAYDAPGIRIVGKGILDGSKVREEPVEIDPKLAEEQRRKGWAIANVKRHDAIRLRFCDDAEITGITIRDSQLYAVCPIYCNRLKVDGVKIVGNWRYNSDGIDLHNCSDAVIRNCFIRTFDDSICVKGNEYLLPEEAGVGAGVRRSDIFENVLVEKCTVWNDWGRALEIGAETCAREIRNVTFRDCDVIWHTDPPLDIQNCDNALVHDITFDDIRVEYDDDMPYLVYSESARDFKPGRKGEIKTVACVTIRYIDEYSPAGAENRGRNSRIFFRNIAIAAPRMPGATVRGLDAEHRSDGVVFENVTLNGKDVTSEFVSKASTNAFATVEARRPKPPKTAPNAGIEPIVPFRWQRGKVETMVRDLRDIHERTGLSRFYLAGPGFDEVMYKPFAPGLYAEMGREIGAVRQALESLGIEINWWCSPSIRYWSDFASIEDAWGATSEDNKKCPLDPAFQADWAAKVKAAVAAARPRIVNIEDDFTLSWGRGLKRGGCFCRRHLARFAEIHGRPLTGPEIAAAFERRTGENLPVRRAFAACVRESLCAIASAVRAAVDEVDPTVRICLCEPGSGADIDGDALEAVVRAFAGPNTRPALRPHGSIYGAQTTPSDIPGALGHTLYTLERLPKDIETFYEADPYPHNRFFSSAAQMGSLMAGAVFMGAENLQLYCLQYLDDPLEDPAYAERYLALKPRLETVRGLLRATDAKLRGVRIVWDSEDLALTRGFGGGHGGQLSEEAFLLAKFGLPHTTRADAKGPAVLAGKVVETMPDDALKAVLSGCALVDAPAADLLAKRGFAAALGTDVELAEGRLPVVREELLPAAGLSCKGREVNAYYIFNAGTEGTVRTFATLKPQPHAEVWSRFLGIDGEVVTPSMTVATNAFGGVVGVLATSLLGNRSSGLLNLRKQELLRRFFTRQDPNALPVAALGAPGVWTLARVSADGGTMLVMVNNLSGDDRDALDFAVAPAWTGAAVSRLNGRGGEEPVGKASAPWRAQGPFAQMGPEFFVFRKSSR